MQNRLAAVDTPELKPALAPATAQFDEALPGIKNMRDVAEHIDEYALDQGRKKTLPASLLEVSTIDEDGPTLH
jgi:hypothetical protein